jgi:hypothetical protein
MITVLENVILSFPQLFEPKPMAVGGSDLRYSVQVLISPTDTKNIQRLQAGLQEAIQNGYPSGMPAGTKVSVTSYDERCAGKDYYDDRFSGWINISCSAKPESKPAIVDSNKQPIIDPGKVFSGCLATVSINFAKYEKGTGGIGAYLNGVMTEGVEGQMGRLDGRPTVDVMFGESTVALPATPAAPAVPGMTAIPGAPAAPVIPGAPAVPGAPAAAPVVPITPVVPGPPAPVTPAAPVRQMTTAANGVSYEEYRKIGWTDQQLIDAGYMLPPGNVPTAF